MVPTFQFAVASVLMMTTTIWVLCAVEAQPGYLHVVVAFFVVLRVFHAVEVLAKQLYGFYYYVTLD